MGFPRGFLKLLLLIGVFGIFLQGSDFSFKAAPLFAQQEILTLPQSQPNNVFAPAAQGTPPVGTVRQPLQPAAPGQQAPPQVQPAQPQPFPQLQRPQIQPQPFVQPSQPQQQPQPPGVAKTQLTKRGEVSFNFDDADVFSVIQTIFGDVLKVNYIVDPNVRGRVNFRSVAPVAKEDVLPLMEVILRLNGIGVVEESGLYRIVPIADISREPAPVGVGRAAGEVQIAGKALVQVVPIKYIQSSEMIRVLTPFLSKNAVIIDVPKSNYIIISDTDANVKRLLHLVEIFDSEALKQVTPQVFVYAVQNGKAKDVASLLQQIFLGAKAPAARPATPATPARPATPGQPAAPAQPQVSMGQPAGAEALVSETTRIIADEITNSIIILATPEDYALIYDTIQKIDIVPRQVVIEGLLARVDLRDNLSFGLSWTLNSDVNITGMKPFKRDINLSGEMGTNVGVITDRQVPAKGFVFAGTDPSGNIRAAITALAEESKAKVLAAPHILVSDNREARIQVGSQIPIATSQTATPIASGVIATNTTTSTIQYKDIGIILKVKPQVNESGLVSLEITQEVSDLGREVVVAGVANREITKTEATTNLVARDGETIIIGGLIQENISKAKDGIPFFSKIPIIGNLFGNTSDNTNRTELIILLTPHVVKSHRDARNVTSDYVDRYKGTTKDKAIDEFIKERSKKEQGNGGKDEKNAGSGELKGGDGPENGESPKKR